MGKYREGNYPSSGTTTYTTARPDYKPGYGVATAGLSASSAASRTRREAAENRRKRADQGMAWDAKSRNTVNNYGLAQYRRMRDYLEKDWAKARGDKEPTRMNDLNSAEVVRRKRKMAKAGFDALNTKAKESIVKRAAKSYGSAWKTGAKSIKSGITGAAKSYGSAWKTGAKTISKSAEKAKKKAANFISKLFG